MLELSRGTVPARPGSQPASQLRRGAEVHKQLLGHEVHAEQYLRLLCQFNPPAVLPFLQSHDSYQCDPAATSVPALREGHRYTDDHISCCQCDMLSLRLLRVVCSTQRRTLQAGWSGASHGVTSSAYATGRHTCWSTSWAITLRQCGCTSPTSTSECLEGWGV